MRRDIAIDGPSGSGKTSVGLRVANELGLMFVDSGLLYRVFTAAYAEQFPSDRCLRSDRLLDILERHISYEPGATVLFDGRVLQLALHDPRVDSLVSPVSAVPQVRAAVNRELRRIALLQDVVMVGRDIGTTVLPKALLKVFITADPDVRARRRVTQLERQGSSVDYGAVLANIKERDAIDSSREDSPLRCTEEHVKLDNSADGSDGVVQVILAEYRRRLEHVV
ncbi:MAG TPA: (d)CMP kinase [Candidatus Cryosericum sp.]